MLSEDWLDNYERMFRSRPLESCGIDSARQQISAITFGRCNFTVAKPPRNFSFNCAQTHLGQVGFQFLRWSGESDCQTITSRSPSHHFTLHIPIKGGFKYLQNTGSLQVDPEHMLLVSNSGSTCRRWCGASDLITITVPREPIQRLLRIEYGLDNSIEFDFDDTAIVDLRQQKTLSKFLDMTLNDLSGSSALLDQPIAGRQAEGLFLTLLLKVLPHRFRSELNEDRSRLAPYYVTRSERYMKENLATNIQLSDLVAASGVSDRSLHYGFKKHRNASPMKYLKRLRLLAAREVLNTASVSPMKVADVANRCGYGNMSQFYRDYKAFAGESPSDTLNRRALTLIASPSTGSH